VWLWEAGLTAYWYDLVAAETVVKIRVYYTTQKNLRKQPLIFFYVYRNRVAKTVSYYQVINVGRAISTEN